MNAIGGCVQIAAVRHELVCGVVVSDDVLDAAGFDQSDVAGWIVEVDSQSSRASRVASSVDSRNVCSDETSSTTPSPWSTVT